MDTSLFPQKCVITSIPQETSFLLDYINWRPITSMDLLKSAFTKKL